MKKFKHIFSFLLCCSMAFGQETEPNNIDFFKGNRFVLDSISVAGVIQTPVSVGATATDVGSEDELPSYWDGLVNFNIGDYHIGPYQGGCENDPFSTDNCIAVEYGYCQDYIIYDDKGTYFITTAAYPNVVLGGPCGGYNNFYDTKIELLYNNYPVVEDSTPNKIYYTINENRQAYSIYSEAEANRVFYFSIDETMSTPNIGLEAFINISFNANTKSIHIQNDQNTTLQKLRLTNILGKKVLEQSTDVNNIDVSALPNGVYVLLIESTKGVLSKKIMMH